MVTLAASCALNGVSGAGIWSLRTHRRSEVEVAPAPGRIAVWPPPLVAVTVMQFCNKAVGNTAGRKRHQGACAGLGWGVGGGVTLHRNSASTQKESPWLAAMQTTQQDRSVNKAAQVTKSQEAGECRRHR